MSASKVDAGIVFAGHFFAWTFGFGLLKMSFTARDLCGTSHFDSGKRTAGSVDGVLHQGRFRRAMW
jgi:hypothetical protein